MPIILIYGADYICRYLPCVSIPVILDVGSSLLKKWQDEVFTYLAKTPAVAGKHIIGSGSLPVLEYSAYAVGKKQLYNGWLLDLIRQYPTYRNGAADTCCRIRNGTADAGKTLQRVQ